MENDKKKPKREMKVWDIVKSMGYSPQENKNIIVSYAPENLSAKVTAFFSNQFYILQICENELVLIPFSKLDLKKEVALEIPFKSIKNISVNEDSFNYAIHIETNEDKIVLSTQQKELSSFRSSGNLTFTNLWNGDNWHKANLDETLKYLEKLGNIHQ